MAASSGRQYQVSFCCNTRAVMVWNCLVFWSALQCSQNRCCLADKTDWTIVCGRRTKEQNANIPLKGNTLTNIAVSEIGPSSSNHLKIQKNLECKINCDLQESGQNMATTNMSEQGEIWFGWGNSCDCIVSMRNQKLIFQPLPYQWGHILHAGNPMPHAVPCVHLIWWKIAFVCLHQIYLMISELPIRIQDVWIPHWFFVIWLLIASSVTFNPSLIQHCFLSCCQFVTQIWGSTLLPQWFEQHQITNSTQYLHSTHNISCAAQAFIDICVSIYCAKMAEGSARQYHVSICHNNSPEKKTAFLSDAVLYLYTCWGISLTSFGENVRVVSISPK